MKGMHAQYAGRQADIRFLRFILAGLALTTCCLGAIAMMAMS